MNTEQTSKNILTNRASMIQSKMNPYLFQNDVALHFELYWKQENTADIHFLVLN